MAREDNLIFIDEVTMQELVEQKELVLMNERKHRIKKQLREKTNQYYKICNSSDLVFMHIQYGYGILLNENIKSNSGDTINLVEILKDYYWFIHKAKSIGRCSKLGNRDLPRSIGSVIAYGDIRKRLPRCCEIHHAGYRWNNAQKNIILLCKNLHKKYHDGIGTRKSHRHGVVIKDTEHFKKFIEKLI